jgi:hypothetical protein
MAQRLKTILLLISLIPPACAAKRSPPQPVAPVTRNGVIYSAPNNDARAAHVIASDLKSGKKLWDVTVFETKYEPNLEEDVQDVFITELRFDGDSLLVRDEKARCYSIDLKRKSVERVSSWRCFWKSIR